MSDRITQAQQQMMATAEPTLVTIREDIYDALLRIALAYSRDVWCCENCPHSDDMALIDAYLPGWRAGV